MRFTRIRLENWRNFSEVDVPLQNRAFIVGANASGKSNFLDVFRFLRDLVVPGGGFQESINRRGGVSGIRNLGARTPSDVVVDVEIGETGEPDWRYRLVFNKPGRGNNKPLLLEEKIWRGDELLLDRPDEADRQDPARLSQTLLEQTFANQPFRAIAEFFQTVTYWHVVPQIIRHPDPTQPDAYGRSFIEQMAEADKSILNTIEKALRAAVPQFMNLKVERDRYGKPHLYGKWSPAGEWLPEHDFSDGTLRLIGLLWAVLDGEGPLLLEEPELSLHPAIVSRIPPMIYSMSRHRQMFISTHSAELFGDEDQGISSDEILLLIPTEQGTKIYIGRDHLEIRTQLEVGLPAGDVVLSFTQPRDAGKLTLPDGA